ncbi:MAG: gamma carbonic anhydrase family protein [Candidatus Izemoplasmatales bacterium]|nr:gamma carbonic anhydrase family protein [Candidatus Izemoplasmatales bacterium]
MIIKYKNTEPVIGEGVVIFPGAIVVGDVTLGRNVNVWYNAVIRGDMAKITIGDNTNIQDGAVIHTNTNAPTSIGANVTIGHQAIVHAATIEDDVLIGMGSIILDGATVCRQALVAAGALVPPGKEVPAGMLAVGNPIKIVRELTEAEIKANRINAEDYVAMAKERA